MRQHRNSRLSILRELNAKAFSIIVMHFLASSCLPTHFARADVAVKDQVLSRISRLKNFALTSTETRWDRMANGESLDEFEKMIKKSYPGLRVNRDLPDIVKEEREVEFRRSGNNYVVRIKPKASILEKRRTELIENYNEARFESISLFTDGQAAGTVDAPRPIPSNNVYTLGLGLSLGHSGEEFVSLENDMTFSRDGQIALASTTIDDVRHDWKFSLDNDCVLLAYSYSFLGQKICEVNCTDFRSSSNLKVPYKFELKTYNGSLQMSEVIASIDFCNFGNVDDDLDGFLLAFPEGVVVSDLRLGRRFKLRKAGALTDADLADYPTNTVRALAADESPRTRIALVSITGIIAVFCLYIFNARRRKICTED